jgi:hypothetical protein
LLLFCSLNHLQIDKTVFYKVLSSGLEEELDDELLKLSKAGPSSLNQAYRGALLMKKAEFEKGVKGKVKTFRQGARKLEQEIERDPGNVEYRFLRLTIQEHAPGILNYNKEIKADKAVVVNGFSKMDGALRSIVLNYAKDSKVLKEIELK